MSSLRRYDSDRSDSSVDSQNSARASSVLTKDTDLSDYSELRPITTRGDTWPSASERYKSLERNHGGPVYTEHVESIAFEDDGLDDRPDVDAADAGPEYFDTDAIPASEQEFKVLFPSTRQCLDIRHDDSTSDGNMNIRVDTSATTSSCRSQKLTLFHLRMYDLKTREFSLRRYCRDSGREVCTTNRKKKQDIKAGRPVFARSLSDILPKHVSSQPDLKPQSTRPSLERQKSSQNHMDENDSDGLDSKPQRPTIAELSDTINLQFMDYSRVDLVRHHSGSRTYYEYEFWGEKYAWQRLHRTDFDLSVTTYHLLRRKDRKTLAHITPKQDGEAQRDKEAGGWIVPSNFWLLDGAMAVADADKVVATGLTAMVDDTIRTVYHAKEAREPTLSVFDPRRLLSGSSTPVGRPLTAH